MKITGKDGRKYRKHKKKKGLEFKMFPKEKNCGQEKRHREHLREGRILSMQCETLKGEVLREYSRGWKHEPIVEISQFE